MTAILLNKPGEGYFLNLLFSVQVELFPQDWFLLQSEIPDEIQMFYFYIYAYV